MRSTVHSIKSQPAPAEPPTSRPVRMIEAANWAGKGGCTAQMARLRRIRRPKHSISLHRISTPWPLLCGRISLRMNQLRRAHRLKEKEQQQQELIYLICLNPNSTRSAGRKERGRGSRKPKICSTTWQRWIEKEKVKQSEMRRVPIKEAQLPSQAESAETVREPRQTAASRPPISSQHGTKLRPWT